MKQQKELKRNQMNLVVVLLVNLWNLHLNLVLKKPRSGEESYYNEKITSAVDKARKSMAKDVEVNQQKDVNINGQVRFVIDAPVGVDTARLTQYVQSPEFRNALVKVLGEIDENGTKPLSSRK